MFWIELYHHSDLQVHSEERADKNVINSVCDVEVYFSVYIEDTTLLIKSYK